MTINGANPGAFPTNPYHIARAYGVQQAPNVGPVKPVQRAVTTAVEPVSPVSRDNGAGVLRDEGLQRLVAGVVPGGVAFDSSGNARPSGTSGGGGAALPFYRHPADRNAAATAVSLGRSLDIQG